MPRAPSAWQIEQAVAAYQRALATLSSNAEGGGRQLTNDFVADEQVILHTLDGEPVEHPLKLLEHVIDACAWATIRAEEADTMHKAFRFRRDRYLARRDLLKQLTFDLFEILGERARSGQLASAHLATSKPGVVIIDEQLLDDRFVQIKRIPNKTTIRQALDDGEVVDGAVLSNPATIVAVRRFATPRSAPTEDGNDAE